MDCDRFELMLADALGGELAPDDRAAFDSHRELCPRCQAEYDSLRGVTESLRTLSVPASVRIAYRQGVLHTMGGVVSHAESSHTESSLGLLWRRPVGIAASILLAFVSGYALHAALMMQGNASPAPSPMLQVTQEPAEHTPTLKSALVAAHARRPHQAALANCFAAMFRDSG